MCHTCSIVAPVTVIFDVAFPVQVLAFLSCSENSAFEGTISRDGFPLLLPENIEKAAKCNNI